MPTEIRPGAEGRSWAWGISAFYAVFVLATLTFVAFAFRQPVDLVSRDYYQREIEHQQHIERLQRTHALPAELAWTVVQRGDTLVCRFPASRLAAAPQGQIHLYRPADASLDRHWPIALDAGDSQRLLTGPLAAGAWTLKIHWSVGTEEYYSQLPLTLR